MKYEYFFSYTFRGIGNSSISGEGSINYQLKNKITDMKQIIEVQNFISEIYKKSGNGTINVVINNWKLLTEIGND